MNGLRPAPVAAATTIRARLDTPISCLLVVAIVLAILTLGRLARSDFDPSAFIVAGDGYTNPAEAPRGIAVLKDSSGYDGQFYYRLALNPFTSSTTEFGITLDNAPYRHQRILYPLLVHLASGGNADLVPTAMIAVNFVFFCLMAWVAAALAQTVGRHALWGLLIVGFPGFLITYSRDLVEIVEATFLLGSMVLIRRGHPRRATAALTMAVLTRETSLIAAVAAAIVFAWERLRERPARRFGWYYFAVPTLAFGAVQLALYFVWGRIPVQAGHVVLAGSAPIAFTASWWNGFGGAPTNRIVQLTALSFIAGSAPLILHQVLVTRAALTERLTCILYGALFASLGALAWAEDIAFLRVYSQFYVFGASLVVAGRSRITELLLSMLVLGTWTVEFSRFIGIQSLLRSGFGGRL